MSKSKRVKRKPWGDGAVYQFHGAYKSKAKAESKARKVKGFFKYTPTRAGGDWRYVVMAKRDVSVPF